jgi:cytosine/adenosine deaminase-related metal-dependent hydrolase
MAVALIVNARLATMRAGRYSLIEDGALRIRDGRIAWIGTTREAGGGGGDVLDAQGALVTPGSRRLPHAPRLRGRSRGGIRAAPEGREL